MIPGNTSSIDHRPIKTASRMFRITTLSPKPKPSRRLPKQGALPRAVLSRKRIKPAPTMLITTVSSVSRK